MGRRNVDGGESTRAHPNQNTGSPCKCFSFQFAANESRVSVVQYSGSKAQEVVQLGTNIGSLTDFKQWVLMQPDKPFQSLSTSCFAQKWFTVCLLSEKLRFYLINLLFLSCKLRVYWRRAAAFNTSSSHLSCSWVQRQKSHFYHAEVGDVVQFLQKSQTRCFLVYDVQGWLKFKLNPSDCHIQKDVKWKWRGEKGKQSIRRKKQPKVAFETLTCQRPAIYHLISSGCQKWLLSRKEY